MANAATLAVMASRTRLTRWLSGSRWTVRQLLYVLQGQVDSVTVEDVGEIGEGTEFTLQRGNAHEVHQVKRQYGSTNEWKLSALNAKGVLAAAQRHVAAGRTFCFVSTVPARTLDELTGRARQPDCHISTPC